MGFALGFFLSFCLGSFSFVVFYLYNSLLVRPQRIRNKLVNQGIKGPPPSFLYGNVPDMKKLTGEAEMIRNGDQFVYHDYPSKIFPYFHQWRKDYGPVFVYSKGTAVLLYVMDPNFLKEMNLCKSLAFGKPSFIKKERRALIGNGIMNSNGVAWLHQRKIIAPELYMSKVKGMVDLMVESTKPLFESWETIVERDGGLGNIRIDEDIRSFSADAISRSCFGSSYSKGKEIFQKIKDIQKSMSEKKFLVGIPGSRALCSDCTMNACMLCVRSERFIPIKNNRKIWRLEREINSLILKMLKERREDPALAAESDLLKAMLESAASTGNFGTDNTNNFVVDNCKNIYFAGHETTAICASWTLMLLSMNPEWQARVRSEVVEVCRGRTPDGEMLQKMKFLTMVIQESLRLYPPAPFAAREIFEEMKFANISIPVGTNIWFPVAALQQEPEIWGVDAHIFNPERFSHGISGACNFPYAYMPFGLGSRTCVGQNFAMAELKVLLSLILSRFTFSLSPDYRHSPKFNLIIEPEYGVNLLMKKVECQVPVQSVG